MCESWNPGTTALPASESTCVPGPLEIAHVVVGAHRHDPVAADRDRLRPTAGGVAAPDVGVDQDQLGGLGHLGRDATRPADRAGQRRAAVSARGWMFRTSGGNRTMDEQVAVQQGLVGAVSASRSRCGTPGRRDRRQAGRLDHERRDGRDRGRQGRLTSRTEGRDRSRPPAASRSRTAARRRSRRSAAPPSVSAASSRSCWRPRSRSNGAPRC